MTGKSDMGRSLSMLTGFDLGIGMMYEDFHASGKTLCSKHLLKIWHNGDERLLAPSLRNLLGILSLPCAFRVFSEQRYLFLKLSPKLPSTGC